MSFKIPRLLLFDIDGTLTKFAFTSRMHGDSIMQALSQAFGTKLELKGCVFAGGTDPSIADDVLVANGITRENCKNYDNLVAKSFELMPIQVQKGIDEGIYKWKSLPNVHELLQALSKRDDVTVALLTGNLISTARMKLESAGINTKLFMLPDSDTLFGAFGSDHGVRKELVEVARKRYSQHLQTDIGNSDMVVIGDTPKDISCAHDNNVPCVAVTTGSYSAAELAAADCVLEGFDNLEQSIEAIVTTCKK